MTKHVKLEEMSRSELIAECVDLGRENRALAADVESLMRENERLASKAARADELAPKAARADELEREVESLKSTLDFWRNR